MLTALVFAAVRSQTVTFEHPCAHSSVVLEALGEELGVKMAAHGSVLKDYFAVRFTDRSPEVVKRLIAETLNAEWRRDGEYLVLDRGPKQLKQEQDEEDEALRAGIAKFLADNPAKDFSIDLVKERLIALSTTDPGSPQYPEALQRFRGVMPRDLLPAELARGFSVEALIAIEDGSSRRYHYNLDGGSDLPVDAKAAVKRYVDNLALSLSEAQKLGAEGAFYSDGGPLLIGKCDYGLTVSRSRGNLEFLLEQMPPRGASSQAPVGAVRFNVFKSYSVRDGKKPELPTLSKDYSLTAIERSLVTVALTSSRQPATLEVAAEDRQVALNCGRDLVANEPLSLYGCAPLFAVAREADRDFVALVPDGVAFDGSWMKYVQTKDLNVVWSWWLQRMTLREDAPTGIMMIQPRYVRWERDNRYDRAAMSRFINAYLETGYNTLESVADLAVASDDDQIMARQSEVACRFLGVPVGVYFGNWIAYRAYGELPASKRLLARRGGVAVGWKSLSPVVRSAAEETLLSPMSWFGQDVPRPETQIMNGGNRFLSDSVRGAMSKHKTVPSETSVAFRVGTGERLRPKTDRLDFWSFGPNLFDVDGFAASRRSLGGVLDYFDFDKAAVTTVERLHVVFWVPDVGAHYLAAQLDSGSRNTKYVPLDQLPEPWRTDLSEAIKRHGGGQ